MYSINIEAAVLLEWRLGVMDIQCGLSFLEVAVGAIKDLKIKVWPSYCKWQTMVFG